MPPYQLIFIISYITVFILVTCQLVSRIPTKYLKNPFLLISYAVLIFLIFWPSMITYESLLYEYYLYRRAQKIYSHPLPPETKLISKETHLIPPVNGSFCTSQIQLTVETTLSNEELNRYYDPVFPLLNVKPSTTSSSRQSRIVIL